MLLFYFENATTGKDIALCRKKILWKRFKGKELWIINEGYINIKAEEWNTMDELWNVGEELWNSADEAWNVKGEPWNVTDEPWNTADEEWNVKEEKWNTMDETWNVMDEKWNMMGEKWNVKVEVWNTIDEKGNIKAEEWNVADEEELTEESDDYTQFDGRIRRNDIVLLPWCKRTKKSRLWGGEAERRTSIMGLTAMYLE